MRTTWISLVSLSLGLATTGCDEEPGAEHDHEHEVSESTPELPELPEGASIRFAVPANGALVEGELDDEGKVSVHVEMAVEGVEVQPAGEVVPGTGHHHVIIDGEGVASGEVVPADETHIHFGGGQTETDVALTPGEHTLTLQFADGIHRSYGPPMSTSITITVSEEGPEGEPAGEGESDGEDEGESETEAE